MASLFGAAVVAGTGWLLAEASLAKGGEGLRRRPFLGWIVSPLADSFTRLSFDLPFILLGRTQPPPACIVYLDEGSARALGQVPDAWDRRLHAALVRKLRDESAAAVLFDIVFAGSASVTGADEEFAAAIRENGHVYLGAALELEEGVGSEAAGLHVVQERVIPPVPILRRAAAGWGLLAFRPIDADYGVRRIYPGTETVLSAPWVVARGLGARLPETWEKRVLPRWMNYYGPADLFPSVGYDRALAADGPRDFFRGRVVVVGGRSTLGALRLGKDEFRGPNGWLGGQFFKGPEVHLTALMNLLRGEWLTRISPASELWLIVAFGLILGAGLPMMRPHAAAGVAVVCSSAIAIVGLWLMAQQRMWFAWAVAAAVQTPLALVWAIGARYFIEERRRRALREAFAHYLSPQMADRIADADYDLSLGGTVVEATVMFTDLENFTPLSEELENPERISEVLTTYFTQTTGHILENDGTIIKYLGDSVQAAWGAPLPDPHQARKAVLAAWRLHEASVMEVQGHPLRTRIGVNTGQMLSGNLGSAQRFDYAITGDAVNFGSRLEGMNKFLGTNILISDTTKARIGDEFLTRCVGEFRVVGKKVARVIYELLGPAPASAAPPQPWLDSFARGLAAFRAGDLDVAEAAMHATIAARGADGPSRFYLEQIAELRARGVPAGWTGIVELHAK